VRPREEWGCRSEVGPGIVCDSRARLVPGAAGAGLGPRQASAGGGGQPGLGSNFEMEQAVALLHRTKEAPEAERSTHFAQFLRLIRCALPPLLPALRFPPVCPALSAASARESSRGSRQQTWVAEPPSRAHTYERSASCGTGRCYFV